MLRAFHRSETPAQAGGAGRQARAGGGGTRQGTAHGGGRGWTLDTHSQLFGFWRFADARAALPEGAPPRLVLETVRGVAALYAAPSIALWASDALGPHPYLARLGPDVLDPKVDARILLAHLRAPRFAKRTLAALLLDQGFAAGMGNYLRSEVL